MAHENVRCVVMWVIQTWLPPENRWQDWQNVWEAKMVRGTLKEVRRRYRKSKFRVVCRTKTTVDVLEDL